MSAKNPANKMDAASSALAMPPTMPPVLPVSMVPLVGRVATVLRRIAGLEVDLVGASSVTRVVTARVLQLHASGQTAGVEAYLEQIEWDREEQQWLIDAVVVPETWFFRHRQAFDYLQASAQDHLRRSASAGGPGGGMRPWRIASVPCSTGEEPYSIAMALMDAGMSTSHFTIDAFDISSTAVDQARLGFYRRNAFRGNDSDHQKRYFIEQANGWQISPAVRACVSFRLGNLMLDDLFPADASYDVVFCRNVLIYFDRPTQHAVVARLAATLRPNGILFVGPAESALATNAGLRGSDAPLSFAFRHAAAKSLPVSAAPSSPSLPSSPATLLPPRGAVTGRPSMPGFRPTLPAGGMGWSGRTAAAKDAGAPAATRLAATSTAASTSTSTAAAAAAAVLADPAFVEAERLANQGDLDAANAACRAVLAARGPSAQVYHLLGLIADARGSASEAREHFRRAVYLDAHHAQALLQLAAHAEMDGDTSAAERLTLRARRARPDLF